MIRLAKADRAIRRLYRAIDELPPHERFPFSDPMEDLLATTVSTQERWVSNTEAYLPKAFKRIKKKERFTITHSRNTGSMVRSAILEFIGKLVGFFSRPVFSQFHLESCRSSQAHILFHCLHASFISPAGGGLDSRRRVVLIQHKNTVSRIRGSRRHHGGSF
jgi:hypothetical protein